MMPVFVSYKNRPLTGPASRLLFLTFTLALLTLLIIVIIVVVVVVITRSEIYYASSFSSASLARPKVFGSPNV